MLPTSKIFRVRFYSTILEIETFKQNNGLSHINKYQGSFTFPNGARFIVVKSFNETNIYKVTSRDNFLVHTLQGLVQHKRRKLEVE